MVNQSNLKDEIKKNLIYSLTNNNDISDIKNKYNHDDFYSLLIDENGKPNDFNIYDDKNGKFKDNLFKFVKLHWGKLSSNFLDDDEKLFLFKTLMFMNPGSERFYQLFESLVDNGFSDLYKNIDYENHKNMNIDMNKIFHIIKNNKDTSKDALLLVDVLFSYIRHKNVDAKDILILKDEINKYGNIFNGDKNKDYYSDFSYDNLMHLNINGEDKHQISSSIEKYEILTKNFDFSNGTSSLYHKNNDEFFDINFWKGYKNNMIIFDRLVKDNYLDVDKINKNNLIGIMIGQHGREKKNDMCSIYMMAIEKFNYDLTKYEFPLNNILLFHDLPSSKKVKLKIAFNDYDGDVEGCIYHALSDNLFDKNRFEKLVMAICNIEFDEKEKVVNILKENKKIDFDLLIRTFIENNQPDKATLIEETYRTRTEEFKLLNRKRKKY